MQIAGDYLIEAPRHAVWQALNDPEILRQCIPGCESFEGNADEGFSAVVKAKVGPLSAKFNGSLTLSDLNPPESCTLAAEGRGGIAGFAKGGAKVHLAEEAAATRLGYEVEADVGGRLAKIGLRLVDGTAKKLADGFFERFSALVIRHYIESDPRAKLAEVPKATQDHREETMTADDHSTETPPADDMNADVGAGASIGVWVAGAILGVLILLAICCLG